MSCLDITRWGLLAGPAKHHILECLPIFDAHESVEERVEGAGEIVENSWESHNSHISRYIWVSSYQRNRTDTD